MSVFSERLVEARVDRGLTQKKLAELIGVTPTRLNYWEKGKAEPDLEFILKLCRALEVGCDWLIGLSDTKKGPGVETAGTDAPYVNEIVEYVEKLPPEKQERFIELVEWMSFAPDDFDALRAIARLITRKAGR